MSSRPSKLLSHVARVLWPALLSTAGLLLSLAPDGGRAQGVAPIPAASARTDTMGAQVIVKFRLLGPLMRQLRASGHAAAGPRLAATLGRRHGLALSDGRAILSSMQVVRGGKAISSAALAAVLAADPDVEFAVPDQRRHALVAPNDPLYAANPNVAPPGVAAGQWYLRPPDATFVSAIDAETAWALNTGSPGVVVADLDTGVRPDHPDLAAKLFAPTSANLAAGFTGPFVGWDFITSQATANDGNGRDPDASDPGDWITSSEANNAGGLYYHCGPQDSSGNYIGQNSSWHGTQTAGLLGAQTGNGLGMASVGHDVMLMPLRVLGKCGGVDSDITAAMLWAAGFAVPGVPPNPHPAKIINLSLGSAGSCSSTVYQSVIGQVTAVGVTVIVAAGNEEGLAVDVPANCPGVIAVAALRNTGTKVAFSSLGPEISISAPGGNCINETGTCLYPILTTTNSGTTTPAINTYSDSSNPSLGTSFSAPLVTGTVALMISANPSITPSQILTVLKHTSRAFPTTSPDPSVPQCRAPSATPQDECICTATTCGAGMLDAGAAVAEAAANAPPAVSISTPSNTVTAGTVLEFSSSTTTATGRSIGSYAWSITSGGAIAAIQGATDGASVSVGTTGAGSFTLSLTVTDSTGATATATSTVAVNPPAGPTVSLLASATTVAAGSPLTFDGSGSAAHAPATLVSYQWSITSGASLATITSSTGTTTNPLATVSTRGSGSGTFVIQLAVTDSFNQVSTSTQTVTVTPVTPTASIAASATAVAVGSPVSFDGSGSTATAGRTIQGYAWSITSGAGIAKLSGSSTASSVSVTPSAAGSFTVSLTVTDSAGAVATRDATVTVSSPTPTGSSSGGGGGGAMSPLWVLGVALASFCLARSRRSRRAKQVGFRT